MRTVVSFAVAAILLAAAPFAEARERRAKPAPDARVAVVDDEPTSHAATETPRATAVDLMAAGARREIQVSAPEVQSAARSTEAAHPTEHAVTVPVPEVPLAPVGPARTKKAGWLADLEEAHGRREMRPYLGALGSCTQRKLRREPDARGTLILDVTVGADQIAHAKVTESNLEDPQLKSCLEGIVEGRTFNTSNLHFSWTVKIFPRTTIAAQP